MGYSRRKVLCTAETIAASGSWTSEAFGIAEQAGVIGYCIAVTGSGTCKIDYLLGPTPANNYIQPGATAVDGSVITGLIVTSGVNGEVIGGIAAPIYGDCMKLKVTETGAANSVTITLWVYLR
jgi:hypothetical protein